jgi:hypothetical protein
MSRTRASLITAVVLVVLGIAASRFVPTQAAWNDTAFFTATASTGTWVGNGDISDGGISVGNTTTVISDIAWTVSSPTQFCVVVTVTGTSPTPQPWQLDVDLAQPPFNGVTVNDVSIQRGETAPGPDNTMIVTGTMRPGKPFNRNNNNSPITNTQEAFPRLCVSDAPLAQGDSSWYTVTVTEGTGTNWSPTLACLTVTVTTNVADLALNPFFYAWQTTLSLAPALDRITSAGGTPDAVEWTPNAGGSNFDTAPTIYNPVQPSYAITSGTDTAIRGQGSGDETATVIACVRDFG